jgi:DnaJ-class molecular chaperone
MRGTSMNKDIETLRNSILASQNHYETLGVGPGFGLDAIRVSYKRRVKLLHPDVCSLQDANDLCARLNVAMGELECEKSRNKHDLTHSIFQQTCPVCEGRGTVVRQRGFTNATILKCSSCEGGWIPRNQRRNQE